MRKSKFSETQIVAMLKDGDAIGVALLGLTVNVISAWILRGNHQLVHGGLDSCDHAHDHNLRAAYLHPRARWDPLALL